MSAFSMSERVKDRIVACALHCEQAMWLAMAYEGNAQPAEAQRARQRAKEESEWAFTEVARS